MQYGIIRARVQTLEVVETDDPHPHALAGLDHERTDHGVALPGIGIIVDEFSLFVPASEQHYFCIGMHLYAGNAVLYSYDERGVSRDFADGDRAHVETFLHFFNSAAEVEQAIADGAIRRPRIAVPGKGELWTWPAPAPAPGWLS